MKRTDFNRRDFNKLTVAAFGGIVAGTAIGCGGGGEGDGTGGGPGTGGGDGTQGSGTADESAGTDGTGDSTVAATDNPLLSEPHVCRGLNTCKGHGQSKENECAGLSTCATVEAHACAKKNDCKGQGGCGANPGQNSCKGMGGCEVPLMDEAWKSARTALEAAFKKQGKELGAAPAKPEEG